MDEVTRVVRDFYEEFPYPSGPPVLRVGFDARLLLSYGRLERSGGRPIRVLDAGCGRGRDLLAAASMQPDVEFLGIDVNRVGLQQVERDARERGIGNVRTQAVDLMTLAGLEAPLGGFDVIRCSGVIHHLSEPATGLANLARMLARHGVLDLMVYSKRGREHIHPIARAIDLLTDRGEPTAERLRVGRELVQTVADLHEDEGWVKASRVDDVEFVDRYLNPQETSYDVESLWQLMEASGLTLLRWAYPEAWDVTSDLPPGALRERAQELPPRERFRLMQELRRGGRLHLFLGRPGNEPRPALDEVDAGAAVFAVHPEGTFESATRSLWGRTRIETIAWCAVDRERWVLPKGPLASAALILRDQNLPFRGAVLVEALAAEGIDAGAARRALVELCERDVLYRPHEAELAVGR